MNDKMTNVHPGARIGRGVEISPFTTIAENVEIGDGCWIGPGVTIFDYVRLGRGCKVFPGAVIGAIPQDLKFQGEETWVEIGEGTTIRECATINRGTAASGKFLTRVGSDCLIMSYVHIAHDCNIGNHCIFSSFSGFAGEVDAGDWAIVGGGTMVHQFSHIGEHAMVGGAAAVTKDIPPYTICGRNPAVFEGVNLIGLRRRNFPAGTISEISAIYKMIYNGGLNVSDACRQVKELFDASDHRDKILQFIENSKRGIVR
ncbi:MAG: acyl-ACP--UDP-N-acetylglucosamine O-acyltransferase [Bacteroidales bacterium]|nr:acyl-ACP--UDP-N-acetylglucosamine O-acyltransferase [Bacteroidales bacterium]